VDALKAARSIEGGIEQVRLPIELRCEHRLSERSRPLRMCGEIEGRFPAGELRSIVEILQPACCLRNEGAIVGKLCSRRRALQLCGMCSRRQRTVQVEHVADRSREYRTIGPSAALRIGHLRAVLCEGHSRPKGPFDKRQ
jgi:hypothetical protein